MQFSPAQKAIEKEVKEGTGHIAVEATAGAGKSTTLLMCLNAIPKTKKTIFISFSKAIVEELRPRIPKHVKASTLHSLGCRMIMKHYPGVKIDDDKYFREAIKMFPKEKDFNSKKAKENFKKSYWIKDIVNFARMTLTPFNQNDIEGMCKYYGLDFTEDVMKYSLEILKGLSNEKIKSIDFTDMIYLPVSRSEIIDEKFDVICIDEMQDLGNNQKVFIESILANKGRFIAVGDGKQAIYSFAGSNVDSFYQFQQKEGMKKFHLPVTYRCSKQVVELAKTVYDDIEAWEGAIEGEVRHGSYAEIGEGDMVLSRTTMPLIELYFLLLERNIKATIIGKDIESGLVEFAKRIMAPADKIVQMKINAEIDALKEELKELGFIKVEKHQRYVSLIEKIQVIELILRKIDNPMELVNKIHEIFAENKSAARLMTIHRSKGLEAKRVFVIESHNKKALMPSEYATQEWELIQEKNLAFVCYTRAKESTILIDL